MKIKSKGKNNQIEKVVSVLNGKDLDLLGELSLETIFSPSLGVLSQFNVANFGCLVRQNHLCGECFSSASLFESVKGQRLQNT